MKVEPVELGSKEFEVRLRGDPARLAAEVCSIDVVNLDKTLQEHAALRAWVNATYEMARIALERAEWEVTKTRATVLLRVAREAERPDGKKGKTVGVMEAEVTLAPEVVVVEEARHAVQERCGALRAMADALEDRKDMLVQIAAKQRREQTDYAH